MTTKTTEIRSITRTTIEHLAGSIAAWHNCKASGNIDWLQRHADHVAQICRDILPSGSGVDSGCTINLDACAKDGDRIVIEIAYHHMDEGGGYDGWTEHTITVTPSFIGGVNVRIGGRNRNDIKDYLGDLFQCVLTEDVVYEYNVATDTTSFRLARV